MRRALFVALALAAACFSEDPSSGGPDATTGESCTPKSLGCPCVDGACETVLSCEPSIQLCIDPSCTPGSELCTCVDGDACLTGLRCIGGLCRPPMDGESTGAATSSAMTSAPPGDDTTLPGEADVTTASDTVGPPTTSITATGDDTPVDCTAMGCPDCYLCQIEESGACAKAWTACKGAASDCQGVAECANGCDEGQPKCISDCCEAAGVDPTNSEFNALGACLELACPHCVQELSCVP